MAHNICCIQCSNSPRLYNVEKIIWPTIYVVFSVVEEDVQKCTKKQSQSLNKTRWTFISHHITHFNICIWISI
jgi:hypothetical protein